MKITGIEIITTVIIIIVLILVVIKISYCVPYLFEKAIDTPAICLMK